MKHASRVEVKERRDADTTCLPGVFLQDKADDEYELFFVKITGTAALMLVESDESK